MNKQRVVSRLQLLDHRVVERILVKEIIVEDEQNVFSILKMFDVDLIPPFETNFNTRGLKKLKRWMILHCINILTSLKRASFLFSLRKSRDKLTANILRFLCITIPVSLSDPCRGSDLETAFWLLPYNLRNLAI